MKLPRLQLGLTALCLAFTASAASTDLMESGFQNPPDTAKPNTWWHWMNGNITKAGITADLEAMKQIGLGGATIVNVDCSIPRGNVPFMSPEWREDFKFAISEADRLGFKLCVENCAGWSSSGGPWITATNAMQKVTSSEVSVTGPVNYSAHLPQPPTNLGFYRDIAVLAFPTPAKPLTIDNIAAKAGFSGDAVLSAANADVSATGAVPLQDVVDLTDKMSPDGNLNWQAPAGQWTILRVGYTPIGVNNHPAPTEGLGLECDKLSKTALDAHWAGFMQKVLDDIGPLAGRALNNSLIDSYEVGGQNWTADFRAEFQKRRGYDLVKYLPAFTGRVVASPAISERFLWDIRRTIADLFADNYFGHFTELCHQHGLQSAVEPYTGPFESLQSGAPADIVMGEFWSGSQGETSIKLAASVAHIYGKTVVGAESFTAAPGASTGRWLEYPYSLKTLGDLMFCQGLNRYYFHRYAMQPWTNRWPGMTMGEYGFHFERTETWWTQGKAWIDYISRCEFLLQQGRAVADAAYFTGESAPVEMRGNNPAMPAGYDYDAVNADVLLHHASVQNGRLTLDGGASYAALILSPEDSNMTPPVLARILELARDGATIVGPRPQHSPSLAGYPDCDAQVQKLTDDLWGACDGTTVLQSACGKGRVIWGQSLADVLAAQYLSPDFSSKGVDGHARLAYAHRIAGPADIYFVSNQRRQFDSADCTFRVTGKIPELWHPDTGLIETAPVWHEAGGLTTVRVNFDPADSVFVIFRNAAASADHLVAANGDDSLSGRNPHWPKLEIKHAVYTAVDGAGQMDVTAKLVEMASGGQLVTDASNGSFGGDPANMHVKELRVEYTLDDQPHHATIPENETLSLPSEAALGLAPKWETSVTGTGSSVVKLWGNGQVALRTAGGTVLHATASDLPAPTEITGPWQLNFPPDRGAPPTVTLDKLISWSDHTTPGVRYFSGTATYEKEIKISADRLTAGRELWLDLGAVDNFAEVSCNGHNFGVLWKPPFRLNLTGVAKPGVNHLTVKVTNLWPNRLIGDEQLPADSQWGGPGTWNGNQLNAWPQWLLDGKPSPNGRVTFTTWHHWSKDAPLLPSGLLGPVQLQTAEITTLP